MRSDPDVRLPPQDVRGLPVLWLGDSYDEDGDGTGDLPLVEASMTSEPEFRDPRTGEVIRPEVREYTMAYGTCEIPAGEEGGCPVPITLVIQSPCFAYPLAEEVIYKKQQMRGAQAMFFGEGGLRVDTADFTVLVLAVGVTVNESEQRAQRVIENLRGANPEAADFSASTPFRAVTSAGPSYRASCP